MKLENFKKNRNWIILLIWVIHSFAFLANENYFPILTYDLFARSKNFNVGQELFMAKLKGESDFSHDISQEISFGFYWKFIVTVRRMIRENPKQLVNAFKMRMDELNQSRSKKIVAVRFVQIVENVPNVEFEINND